MGEVITVSEAASEAQAGDLRSCTCHVFADQWGRPVRGAELVACGEPAIAVFTMACVHEHMDRALVCAGCAAEIQQTADVIICARCEDVQPSHECPVTIKIEWLGE